MMSLSGIKNTLDETEISSGYFLRLHFCVEAIVRRLFFIGLRMQGIQYRAAEKISEEFPAMGLKNHIERVFGYCGVDYSTLKASSKYANLETLFFEFTVPWRNRLVHGIYREVPDTELIKLLIQADKEFIEEIETILRKQDKPSLFDKPGEWIKKGQEKGQGKGKIRGEKKDTDAVYKELFGSRRAVSPMTVEAAAMMLK